MGFGLFAPNGGFRNSTKRRATNSKKTVFEPGKIAHLWAHKTQDYARNGGSNNFYFDGDTIYSYGSHFPIARHCSKGKKHFILFTIQTYSATTAGHISCVRHAIPPDVKVFNVDDVDNSIAGVRQEYTADVKRAQVDLAASKNKAQRVNNYRHLLREIKKTNEFMAWFGYKTRLTTGLSKEQTTALDVACSEYDASIARRSAAAQLAANTRRENQRRAWEARIKMDAERREQLQIHREAWIENALAGNMEAIPEWYRGTAKNEAAELIDQREWEQKKENLIIGWRNGQNTISYSRAQEIPTMMRIKGDDVETSRGVDFPIAHALKIMPIVEALLVNGKTYKRNGHSIHLGHYTLDSIDEQGTIRAGCHVIEKQETLRLIAELKALPQSAAVEQSEGGAA